ncbi:hypothetical protein KHP62_21345 [Rhodobacteraceae bacterium NNCM2]|nr:hypothetical protein [Coraliihabitans acroporae]
MSYSLTASESTSFTVTHARHMAAKVATDLKRMQRLYGSPSDSSIADYETEAIALMKAGYLNYVWYGYKRNGLWIEPTLKYTAQDLYNGSVDEDPGRIRPGADISGASFYSYLTYSAKWYELSAAERDAFKRGLPYVRTGAAEPTVNGYLSNDKTYSSGGRALERATVRSF